MAAILHTFQDYFWSEWFWLPPGTTWEDRQPAEGETVPNCEDLKTWPFVFMAAIIFFKYCLVTPFVFIPLGKYLGIKSKPYTPPVSNQTLDKLYKVNSARPPRVMLEQCAVQIEWPERKVERWLRRKALSLQMTTLEKFCDYGWQTVHYSLYFIFGMYVILSKDYTYDLSLMFENYPRTTITNDAWWYYMINMGFYYTQFFTLFVHPKKHDFNEMFVHHIFSLCILNFNWASNFVRVTMCGLFIHEIADIPLLLSKMFSYSNKQKWSDYMAVLFGICWIPTRLIAFPFHCMRATLIEVLTTVGGFWPGYFLLNGINFGLLTLHFIWTGQLIKTVRKRFTSKSDTFMDSLSTDEKSSEDENSTKDHISDCNGNAVTNISKKKD